jgi:hypothetical protein
MWIEYGIKLDQSLLAQLLMNSETGKLYDDVGPVSNNEGMKTFEKLKTNPLEAMSNMDDWLDDWPRDNWLSINGFKLALLDEGYFMLTENHHIESIIKLHNFMEELKRTNRIPQDSCISNTAE